MEANKSHQVSALLACRSRADLRRLRGMDSPSFPFITLACKHNRPDLLNLLLEEDTSDGAVDVPHRCSVEQEYEGHGAVYFAIRSSNVELLRTLLRSVTPEVSEQLVSESYEDLLLINVLLSEEMHIFVQYKLLDLRFFSKADGALPDTSTADIQERVQLLLENIVQVNTYTEVDSHFLYTAKFIAQNIYILKNLLKSTYNILPWEEMEFCLVSFVSAHMRRQELNLFYLSILRKERLLEELEKFASALQELEEYIRSTDVKKLRNPVRRNREDVVVDIVNRYPHLYADFKEVRDASSLHIMKTYLDAALLADSTSRLGQLTIKRALQVIGEHLKNTLDSPKLSPTVSDLLLLSAPKETRQVLRDLRNSLSHPHLESEDSVLYSNIQNDIKKIASVIIDITNSKKVDKLKSMLTKLVNSDNIDELHEVANFFRNVCIEDVQETDTVTKYHRELTDLIRNIEDQTPYEKKLVTEINYALDQYSLHHALTKEDCTTFNQLGLLWSTYYGHNTKTDDFAIRSIKNIAKSSLKNFQSLKSSMEIKSHFLLADLLLKLYKSVSLRINPVIAFELEVTIFRILCTDSFDKSNINCIDDYRRQTFLEKNNTHEKKGESVKNSNWIIGEQLTPKITELRNTIGTDRMCGQLYEHLSLLYKDKNTNRFMVEALVLDIMSLLDSSKCVPNNVLYLDGDTPLLSGKCLRNHLAHENALLDILPTDVWSAVLLNAVKLTESKDLLRNCKIGNVLKHNITQLRQRYERGLCILDKQKEMWKSLLDGNFDKFALGIAGGADVCSRNRDLSSTLHYAARGPNVETVKFLTKQKIISTEVRDIDGQTATHVAANFGRDVTVKFLVAEIENAINQIDGVGRTPLHLASKNCHKKTVITLLSLGAKTNIKDYWGYSPLHTAVQFKNLDVVKILSVKVKTVDEKTSGRGLTPLHIAAELGHIETIKYFLQNQADVNAKTDQGYSPLFEAALKGHQEVVNALLEKGAHVNLRDCKGHSPLCYTVQNKHKEIIKILLEKGAFVNIGDVEYNNTPLHTAVSTGDVGVVGLLLQHNANVNAKRKDGLTPLLLAAQGGHADIVDLLLQNGALADSKDVAGLTALHHAARFGHSSVVENLIQRGVDIQTQSTCQTTALHLAALRGHQQVIEILLAAGAYIHSVDKEGSTALHLSAANGHEAISEVLIIKGANVNCKNSSNITPLQAAAMKARNEKTVLLLLNNRADVNEKNEHGFTALHRASFVGNSSVVEALLNGKADVDARTTDGITALHVAVMGNHKATVQILLKYGASINLLDCTGASALCIAARNNNKDLLDLLIAKGADVNIGGGQLMFTAICAGHRHIVEALLKIKDVGVNIKDQDESNFLYAAAVSGDALIARELIKRGIKVADCLQNPSPLFKAMSLGHTEFVEVLLASGTNINPVDPNLSPLYHAIQVNKPEVMERLLHWGANSNIRDSKNRTPLELAVGNAQTPNTLILLQQEGVRINERGTDNWTLLHIAAQAGNLEITKILVDRGADINVRTKQDYKPIHIAAMHGNQNILAFFLDLGMSINDPGYAGGSLMHCSALGGQLAVAQYLIDKQVDINFTDLNGFLPIHCSAELGHTEMVKLLLHNGAVYDATDNFGRTPSDLTKSRNIKEVLGSIEKLFQAVKKNDILTVGILIKDLAQYVNVKSSANDTLLHIASWRGFQKICDILLESKANPNAVGKGGNAPLHYASKYSHPGIVESLLKNGAAHNLKADNIKTPLDFATQKDIKYFLQIVARFFRKVRTRDVTVINDITKLRDIEIIKAVMRARDADGNTLVVVAMKNDFSDVDKLKKVSQNNIPDSLSSMLTLEKFAEALGILKQLLRDRIEIFGEDNPGTLDIQHDIAKILLKQFKYFEAMSMLEDIYRKRVETFGPHHLEPLQTRSTMALLLNQLGRTKEAWDIFQEVLPRLLEMLGEEHDILLTTKTYAGDTLSALGKHEEALCLFTEVYKRYKNTLGAHHPYTLNLQNNIAVVLHAQGKHHEALALYRTVYEARKKIQGLNHSETLKARCNMAKVLMDQRKLDEALQILQETLAIQRNVLGLNHRDTIHTQSLISGLYLHQNKNHDAVKIYKAGLNARNAIFGPNHPAFTQLDKLIENIEKRFKTKFDIDLGYVVPCDINFLNASSEGDRGKVCSLIENGSDVNTADDENRTALHFATTLDVVELLLDSGADATAVSQKGNTPLHEATSRACIQTVRLLLQNVKKIKTNAYRDFINAKTAVEGSTALHIASKNGSADIVSCLLGHGACYNSRDRSNNRTPLQCSRNPSVTGLLRLAEKVFEMAERGGTVLPQGDERHLAAVMNSRDTEHRTPLQLALVHGHTVTARILAGFLKTLD